MKPLVAVLAGMPSPLPFDVPRVLRLNEGVVARLQAISFFVIVFLLLSAIVWGLWNYLRRDIPRLPRLSYTKAAILTLLWGCVFMVVLTMISGARELMTPGAWDRAGATYKLATPKSDSEDDPMVQRKRHLERLRTALLRFAATHDGRFPTEGEQNSIGAGLWTIPLVGLRYEYVPGRTASQPDALLVYEPEFDDSRWVLLTNGEIVSMRPAELLALRKAEAPR